MQWHSPIVCNGAVLTFNGRPTRRQCNQEGLEHRSSAMLRGEQVLHKVQSLALLRRRQLGHHKNHLGQKV